MGKRKRDEDKLKKKIKKLEKRLAKKRRKLIQEDVNTSEGNTSDISRPRSPVILELDPETPEQDLPQAQEPVLEDKIDSDILDLLGEPKENAVQTGSCIPEDIAKRWGDILVMGQTKEQRLEIFKKILIPENFKLLMAPKLNPEIASVLTETAKNRDLRLENFQNTLGLGLAGISNLLSKVIKGNVEKMEIIKSLSEIGQVLLNLHYDSTYNRRNLIIPSLDKKFNNIIKNSKRDSFLFGESLGENIKAVKAVENSSLQLKKVYSSNITKKYHNKENFRGPPRQQNLKVYRQGGRRNQENHSKTVSQRPLPTHKKNAYKPTRQHH